MTVGRLRSVEVVRTRVPTADGANAFVLLGESDECGCLVPLGVDLDHEALVALAALPGFDLERYSEAVGRRAPTRTIVWSSPAP